MVLNDHWMIVFLCVKKIYNIVYNKSISFTVKVIKVESHSLMITSVHKNRYTVKYRRFKQSHW
jgi:hypothetical protein